MMERQVGRRWPLGSPHTALPLGRSGKRTPAATKREMRERVGLPNGQHLSCPKPVHATTPGEPCERVGLRSDEIERQPCAWCERRRS